MRGLERCWAAGWGWGSVLQARRKPSGDWASVCLLQPFLGVAFMGKLSQDESESGEGWLADLVTCE